MGTTIINFLKAIGSAFGGLVNPNGARGAAGFAPAPNTSYFDPGRGNAGPLLVDGLGQHMFRGPVFTDEGSFREDFAGASLDQPVTGALTFTAGSTSVTGVGTLFSTELGTDKYIFLDADGGAFAARIATVLSDTELELDSPYAGAGGSGASSLTFWERSIGPGGGIAVAGSRLLISSGTVVGSETFVRRSVDFLPLLVDFRLSLTARVPDQEWIVALSDNGSLSGSPEFVRWRWGGSQLATQAFCESSGGAGAGSQEGIGVNRTIVNSAVQNNYQFALDQENILFREGGASFPPTTLRATDSIHIPRPYTFLSMVIGCRNTGAPAVQSTLDCDVIVTVNVNRPRVSTIF